MSRARLLSLLALSGAALAGCVSLFPKQVPAQMYRFDARTTPPVATADDAPRAEVIAPPVVVARAAATDRILAVTGQETAYVAAARWISPAAVLWDETVRRAFAARAARVRLLTRNELSGGQAFLRLDVPEFEVRYAAPGAAPSARVTLHAMFSHRNGTFSAEHTFTADAPAGADRVSAIVDAFDAGVEQVVAAAVAWSDAHADAAVAEPPVMAVSSAAGPSSTGRQTTRSTSVSSVSTSTQTSAAPRP